MLKFSEIFEFSKEKFRKIPILNEFEWFEWFEWFGPSPIEPFNPELYSAELFPATGQRERSKPPANVVTRCPIECKSDDEGSGPVEAV